MRREWRCFDNRGSSPACISSQRNERRDPERATRHCIKTRERGKPSCSNRQFLYYTKNKNNSSHVQVEVKSREMINCLRVKTASIMKINEKGYLTTSTKSLYIHTITHPRRPPYSANPFFLASSAAFFLARYLSFALIISPSVFRLFEALSILSLSSSSSSRALFVACSS